MQKQYKMIFFIVSVFLNLCLLFFLGQQSFDKNVTMVGSFVSVDSPNKIQLTVDREDNFYIYQDGKEVANGKVSYQDSVLFLNKVEGEIGTCFLNSKSKSTMIYNKKVYTIKKLSDTPVFLK